MEVDSPRPSECTANTLASHPITVETKVPKHTKRTAQSAKAAGSRFDDSYLLVLEHALVRYGFASLFR